MKWFLNWIIAPFKKNRIAWETALALDIPGKGMKKTRKEFAHALSARLVAKGIRNRIVYFHWRNHDGFTGSNAVCIYYDENYPRDPWWLMDATIKKPVWLSSKMDIQDQLLVAYPDLKFVDVYYNELF